MGRSVAAQARALVNGPLLAGLSGAAARPAKRFLIGELRFATLSGRTAWANSIARVLQYSGCGGAAI
jgi:hypothetical protein